MKISQKFAKTVRRWSEDLFFLEVTKKITQKLWVAGVKTFFFFGDHLKIHAKTMTVPVLCLKNVVSLPNAEMWYLYVMPLEAK